MRIAVLASGAGSTFASLADASRTGELVHAVRLLLTSRPGSGALAVAAARGIVAGALDERSLGPAGVDAEMVATLDTHRIDLVVLAGFTRRVGPRTLAARPGCIVNTHPAPLPRFGGRGMYGEHVHRAVLASGVTESAATVHLVDGEYDTGRVIAERPVPVVPGDDVDSLRARVQIAERALLVETLNAWVSPVRPLD